MWHNLLIDPNDLPDTNYNGNLELVFGYDNDRTDKYHLIAPYGGVIWMQHINPRFKENPIIAWRYIEKVKLTKIIGNMVFCPFCNNGTAYDTRIKENNIKYCPYCGEKIL